MLLTVLSLEADGAADGLGVAVGAADGLGGAADGLGAADGCGAVDGLTGTISADTTPLGALRDRSSLGFVSIGCLGSGGGRERERGSVDAGMSDCASMTAGTLSNKAPVFFLGGGLDASRPTDPIWYTSGLGAALTSPPPGGGGGGPGGEDIIASSGRFSCALSNATNWSMLRPIFCANPTRF